MKTNFSKTWISSVKPRKQRKYRYNAPLNVKSKFFVVNLSKELRDKHGARNVRVRKGDKVKILRGNFKGKTALVDRIDSSNIKVYLAGIEISKKDGSKAKIPFNPTNLQIIELTLDDKKRKAKLTKTTTESKK